jgi:hypothetical protein
MTEKLTTMDIKQIIFLAALGSRKRVLTVESGQGLFAPLDFSSTLLLHGLQAGYFNDAEQVEFDELAYRRACKLGDFTPEKTDELIQIKTNQGQGDDPYHVVMWI